MTETSGVDGFIGPPGSAAAAAHMLRSDWSAGRLGTNGRAALPGPARKPCPELELHGAQGFSF